MLKEAFSKITFSSLLWPCAQVVCGKRGGGTKKAFPPKENRGYSLRMGCTLLAPQQAQRYVVQQQGEAPADQRRRCPERSGSSPGSSWPVAERTKKEVAVAEF